MVKHKNDEVIFFRDKLLDSYAKQVSHVFLKNITKSLPQYIFWKDIHSVYLGCNDNYALLHGFTNPDDIIGLTDKDLNWQATGYTADVFQTDDQLVMQGNSITNKEEPLSLPNGKQIITLVSKRAIVDDDGNTLGVIGYFVDITERKRLEQAEVEKQLAEQKTKYIKMLAGSLAHELRTPLTGAQFANQGIQKNLEHLIEVYALANQHQLIENPMRRNKFIALEQALDSQARQLSHCHHIIDLQLKNINLDSITDDDFIVINAKDCIQEAIDQYPLTREQYNLISNQVDNNIEVFIDPILFKHVIWNLLKNALYYIAAANKGDIQIWSESDQKQHFIHVKDTGKGMQAAMADDIFDAFYTKRQGGTGLGLSFCHAVLQTAKGDITCQSKLGEYTQFTLIFPRQND